MPSNDREILNKNAKRHWEKIKDDPEVKRKARERAKEWYKANKERVKELAIKNKDKKSKYMKEWRSKNREHVKKYKVENQRKNMESHLERVKRYHKTEKGKIKCGAQRDMYRKRVISQSMGMFDKESIRIIYKKCKEIIILTGEKYEVDHIVPLCGETASGLHVSWNLRIISREENRKKSNKLDQKLNG